MSKTAVFIDALNVILTGGSRLRYDLLLRAVEDLHPESVLFRSHAYTVFDEEHASLFPKYRESVRDFYEVLRELGFVVWEVLSSEQAKFPLLQVQMANDLLSLPPSVDHVVVVSDDESLYSVLQTLRNRGTHVTHYTINHSILSEASDFVVPIKMLPDVVPNPQATEGKIFVRGVCYSLNERGFGFFRSLHRNPSLKEWSWTDTRKSLSPYDSTHFTVSKMPPAFNLESLPSRYHIFNVEVQPAANGSAKYSAVNIYLA